MLTGLKNLREFAVQDSIASNVKFEYNFLEEVAKSLQTLQLQNCLFGQKAIENVTGTNLVLNQLSSIDFRFNPFLISIPEYGFNVTALKMLYMSQSGIESIKPHAFSNAQNIEEIALSDNKLHTLSKFAFPDDFARISLSLKTNPWNCTCELIWLNHIYIIKDIEETVCSDGMTFKQFLNIDCEEYIPTIPPTASSTDTTISTTIPYVTEPESTHFVHCAEYSIYLTVNDKLSIILIATFAVLFLVLLSNIILFICIRKHPRLLGNNKTVLLLKKPEDCIVMPQATSPAYLRSFTHPEISMHPCCSDGEDTISYVPISDVSYLTPVSEGYMYAPQRPPFKRSVSDLSIKTVASYVSERQLPSWRKNKVPRNHCCHSHQETPPTPLPRNSCTRDLENGIQRFYEHAY